MHKWCSPSFDNPTLPHAADFFAHPFLAGALRMPEQDSLPFQSIRPAPSAAIPIGNGARGVGSARRRKSSFAMRTDSPVSDSYWVIRNWSICVPLGSCIAHSLASTFPPSPSPSPSPSLSLPPPLVVCRGPLVWSWGLLKAPIHPA